MEGEGSQSLWTFGDPGKTNNRWANVGQVLWSQIKRAKPLGNRVRAQNTDTRPWDLGAVTEHLAGLPVGSKVTCSKAAGSPFLGGGVAEK